MPIVSIIIPVYNAEKVLDRCINSILVQTISDFEIILINDGSKDKSGEVCNNWAREDSKIRTFHKENGGASSARNVGLTQAIGDYVCFIDADDWIDPNYLETFFSYGEIDDAIVIQDLTMHLSDQKIVNFCKLENRVYSKSDYSDMFIDLRMLDLGFSVCKVYINKIIKENSISFNEKIHQAEDLLFFLEYLFYIDKVCFSSNSYYNYDCTELNTLSKVYSTFNAEQERFCSSKNILRSLISHYNLNDKVEGYFNTVLGDLFFRPMISLYKQKDRPKKKKRIQMLKSMTDEDNQIYLCKYRTATSDMYIPAYALISHNLFKLFDYYMRFIFFLRVKFNKLWKLYHSSFIRKKQLEHMNNRI